MEETDQSFRRQMEARLGTTLCGRYTLDELIGIGGMAAVYRGHHRNGNRVAIKLLHLELAAAPHIKGRFLREGYVANKVDHPGAVRVLDDDTAADGAVFLVMELLEGETLESRISRRQGRMTADELVPIVIRTLEVLGAAHDKQIVHRDIKPENVFLLKDGGVKVLDFGIARLLDGSRGMTRTGHFVGTPAYMAPEQARGEKHLVGPLSDVWSVGAMAFRALSGRFVHEAPSPEMTMIRTATEQAPKLLEVAPSVTRELSEIVDRALTLEPSGRFSSAIAMADALARWIAQRRNLVPKLFDEPSSSSDSGMNEPKIQRMPSDLPSADGSDDVTLLRVSGDIEPSDGLTRPQLTPPNMTLSDVPPEPDPYTLPQIEMFASVNEMNVFGDGAKKGDTARLDTPARHKAPASPLPRLQLTDSRDASGELETAYLAPVPAAFRPSDAGPEAPRREEPTVKRAIPRRPVKSWRRQVLLWLAIGTGAGILTVLALLPIVYTATAGTRRHQRTTPSASVSAAPPAFDAGAE